VLSEALDRQRERTEAASVARNELTRLREQYRESLTGEVRAIGLDENALLREKGKKWRF
jgi:hypothetical protein